MESVDLYCERLDASFWAEPFNAISNLAFLLAAFAAFLLCKKSHKNIENLALVSIAAIVGIGSFIFHTFATKLAMLADIIPIIIFIHYAFYLILRRIFAVNQKLSLLLIGIFLGINLAIRFSPLFGLLNGSAQYLPAFFALLATAILTYKTTKLFLVATLCFALSLFFRSIDLQICNLFPSGSHFMWHLLNPVVMYCAMRALIKKQV